MRITWKSNQFVSRTNYSTIFLNFHIERRSATDNHNELNTALSPINNNTKHYHLDAVDIDDVDI